MTHDRNSSEINPGLTRRAVLGTLAAAAVVPALRGAAEAQTLRGTPPNLSRTPTPLAPQPFAPPQPTARTAHTATLLQNGLMLVVGGRQFTAAPLSGAQLFDPVRVAWHTAASLQASRSDHAAALLPDGRVLVCGGLHAGGRAMAGCEIYDPRTDVWSAAAPLNVARYGHAATALSNGTVLVTGGCGSRPIAVCEIYDPMRDVWEIIEIASQGGDFEVE